MPHIVSLNESLTDRLTTVGANSSRGNNQTSLISPVSINRNGGRLRTFAFGGQANIPTNFTPPISIVGTTDPYTLNNQNLSLSSGKFINGTLDSNQAMVSTAMAIKNNLKVGSSFTAYGTTLSVAGIFNSNGNQGLGNNLIVSLLTEQRLSGQSGAVTSAVAGVDSIANLSTATTEVKNALGSIADVASTQDLANATLQPLNSVSSVSLYSLIGAVASGAIIILMIMVMITRERRREIGVLKAIGASNLKVVAQFMSEAITFAVLATIFGIIIGVAAASPITNTLVSSSSNSSVSSFNPGSSGHFSRHLFGAGRGLGRISKAFTNLHAVTGWSIIFYGLGAAIIIAIAGSGVAAWFISKIRPAEVMRME